ncbi:MAG: hypothetical protein K8T89_10165 [Planctomycetes bacterium]|nr:hypothetical protein [Planctomycetota bacterium]
MTPDLNLEADPRFPSGKWVGFFTDRRMPGKHAMDLYLSFAQGIMTGSGRDRVGSFAIHGSYQTGDGLCLWVKQYLGQHAVSYRGFNEGKGIWGTWTLTDQGQTFTGGFHIWPDGMPDPTQPVLREEVDLPSEVEQEELVPMGV